MIEKNIKSSNKYIIKNSVAISIVEGCETKEYMDEYVFNPLIKNSPTS